MARAWFRGRQILLIGFVATLTFLAFPGIGRAKLYTVKVKSHTGGTVTPLGTTHWQSEPPEITVTSNPGYVIQCIMLDFDPCSGAGATKYILPTLSPGDHEVDVTFKELTYTVTATAPDGGGTISPPFTEVTPSEITKNKPFILTSVPNASYQLSHLLVNGVWFAPQLSFRLDNVTQDTTVKAYFTKSYKITATAEGPNKSGTIAPSGVQSYGANDQPRYDFFPDMGYAVKEVLVDNQAVEWEQVKGGGRYTFGPLKSSHSIKVVFDKGYVITAAAGANGAINPSGRVSVIKGGSQTFTITPADGYAVDYVLVNGSNIGVVTSYTFSGLNADAKINAYFRNSGANAYSYCNVPPFAASGIKPNLLLLLDNSASMYDLAYSSHEAASYCVDDSYDNSRSYAGYFDRQRWYGHDGKNFIESTVPSSCNTAKTSYLCLDMKGEKPGRTLNSFVATGNFMNWLTMSKLDVEKWVLTGGKFTNGVLEGESRGCQGKRHVKMVKGTGAEAAPQVTFAVRGPVSGDPDYLYLRGGATRLEIYDNSYNQASCVGAVDAWLAGNEAQLRTALDACLNKNKFEVKYPGVPSKSSVYNLILVDCYLIKANKVLESDQVTAVAEACYERYKAVYHQSYDNLSLSTEEGICSSNAKHGLYNGNTNGFIGTGFAGAVRDSSRDREEVQDYCNELFSAPNLDPSIALLAGSNANVPAYIIDAGVADLGNPVATCDVNVAPPASQTPTGLLQQFSNDINIGAMVFYDDGASKAECSDKGAIPCLKVCTQKLTQICSIDKDCQDTKTGVCRDKALTDGGKVISYISYDGVGDHTSELIAAIDGITATSWTPLAESFYNAIGYFGNNTKLRIDTDAWNEKQPPTSSRFPCQKNHVLIVSDGMSTADSNQQMESLARKAVEFGSKTGSSTGSDACLPFAGSKSLDDLAWIAHNRDIKELPSDKLPQDKNSIITTHAIFTGVSNGAVSECDPAELMKRTAANGGGTYTNSTDPATLYDTFRYALQHIANSGSSGTDASILSTGEGNGAIFLQELFYPQKSFDQGVTSATWIGEIMGLWYYIDPFLTNTSGMESTIRDDAGYSSGSTHKLNLKVDNIVSFGYDSNSDSDPTDAVKSIWRAGTNLWQRAASDRKIYTQLDGKNLTDFSSLDTSLESVRSLLQATDKAEADRLIAYTRGEDFPTYRKRKLNIPGKGTGVWKLGDIISSTPKVQSFSPLNSYHQPPPRGYNDASYGNSFQKDGFTDTASYRNRGMVYVGANDGMLHAFRLGKLQPGTSDDVKATLSGTDLGREEWAFIPQNALPYLKYLTYPNYPHLNYVDGSLTLVDASIGSCGGNYFECTKTDKSWRTVLIGGMGLGGASKTLGDTCLDAADKGTCVKAPVPGAGLSSYFALDVTDQSFTYDKEGARAGTPTPPKLLWELSDPDLGYASSGAAIIKVQARVNGISKPDLNGHWYAVFASGPTGPIDGSSRQFKGTSGQTLKFFVVELNTNPPLVKGTNYWVIDTGITDAFGGSMVGAGIDTDKWNNNPGNYQDDALYVGYTRKAADGTWTDGGVIRLLTGEDPSDPAQWKWSTVIEGIGPVTAAVTKLQDRKNGKLWLYFGTGRYFYNNDDMSGARALFGVQESCYTKDNVIDARFCKESLSGFAKLSNKTSDPSAELGLLDYQGWYILLDGGDTSKALGSERVITSPSALTSGAVYFTTFKPSSDPCKPQGLSYLWGVRYGSGGSLGAGSLSGKAIVPLSTGEVNEVSITETFDKGKRRGDPVPGKPGGVKFVTNSGLRPLKKIMHMQER